MTSWGHDPSEIPLSGALSMLLDALQHSAVLVQAVATRTSSTAERPPEPLEEPETELMGPGAVAKTMSVAFPRMDFASPVLSKLDSTLDLTHACGYVTLLDLPPPSSRSSRSRSSSPVNGRVGREEADLLAAELDGMGDDGGGGDRDKKIRSLSLQVGRSRTRRTTPNWTLLDVNFGIPLFDAKLNKDVCERIVSCDLWKKKR